MPPSSKENAKPRPENVDSLDKKDSPPPLPPKFPQVDHVGQPFFLSDQIRFNNLPLSNDPPPSISPAGGHFVGGFDPNLIIPRPPTFQHSSSALNMPSAYHYPANAPQSMTMQMALDDDTTLPPIRPHYTPELPLSTSQLTSKPTSKSPRPIRKGSASASPTPKDQNDLQNDRVQCAGTTKAHIRCTHNVKTAASLGDDQNQVSPDLPRYCWQHKKGVRQNDQFRCAGTTQKDERCKNTICQDIMKKVLEPSGYYSKKNGEFVTFDDWIPQYLQAETRAALRDEMQKSRSSSDDPGYIYTFEIREPSQNKTIKLKVGRAVKLVKRINQWGKQCGSKEQILRGFYPGVVGSDEDRGEGSLMTGQVKTGEKAAWCHRLERLIHLELADLVATCVYLDPEWPKVKRSSNEVTITFSPRKKSKQKKNSNAQPCQDCGTVHIEIFEFERWKGGQNAGKEWELVVKPVVERWGRFVELYV